MIKNIYMTLNRIRYITTIQIMVGFFKKVMLLKNRCLINRKYLNNKNLGK